MKCATILLSVLASLFVAAGPLAAEPVDSAQAAYAEMEQMFGTVPGFLRAYPRAAIAGAWADMKALQFSDDTALPGKVKELIGLAVAAQIPCSYCVHAHTAAARSHGASDQEIAEAIALAAQTRHWSTVLNGFQTDLPAFRREFDAMMQHTAQPVGD